MLDLLCQSLLPIMTLRSVRLALSSSLLVETREGGDAGCDSVVEPGPSWRTRNQEQGRCRGQAAPTMAREFLLQALVRWVRRRDDPGFWCLGAPRWFVV